VGRGADSLSGAPQGARLGEIACEEALFGERVDEDLGDGMDDRALVGVIGRENDEEEFGAVGEFDVGGVVAGLARPAGFRPELRAGGEDGAGECGLVVGIGIFRREVAGEERHHFSTTRGGDALAGGDRGEETRGRVGGE